MLVFIVAILTVFIIFVIIYIVTGQSKLKVLVATMALQRVRAVEALNTNRQTPNCNSELLKNDLKSGYSGVITAKKNQKECVLLRTTLFQHGKDKIISGRHKILCLIRSKQNSQEHPFVQVDRRTVIGKCYFKEELDIGCIRN